MHSVVRVDQDVSSLFSRFFHDLSSRHPDVRQKAAHDLRVFVEEEVRDLPSESCSNFLNQLTNRVFDLVNSADIHEKLGGILVIDELIEVKAESTETMI